jgi:2-polyprenyl-3-methyl-5-hydroxy-6-metoxy-1,4-benzoquinol methylase
MTAENAVAGRIKHLPYQVDPANDRYAYYENLWKKVGLDLLKKHVDVRGLSLLDYGCGRGESLEIFGAAGMNTTGADTDPECVRLSSMKSRAVLLNPSDPLAQFGEKSFDVVCCFHVLEHVPAPVETLRALSKIARSHLVLAVPNLRNLFGMFKREFNLAFVNEGHLQSWDHYHFLNLAERHCNLELVEWASDATILSGVSNFVVRVFGQRAAIKLETGLFKRLFPYHCISVLGLFRPKAQQ